MKEKRKNNGRRVEMKVSIGAKTMERFQELRAENDFSLIASSCTPPAAKSTVWRFLKAAEEDPAAKFPVTVVTAIRDFYVAKEKAQKAQEV